MTADILGFFPPVHTDVRELVASDGRKWNARSYFYPHELARLTPGNAYCPYELVRLYGLPTRNGEPGLFLYEGERLPDQVRYVIEPIDSRLS